MSISSSTVVTDSGDGLSGGVCQDTGGGHAHYGR